MEHYILAAGKSERIFNKIKINKCLIKINGITLIDNIINNSVKNNISKISVITGFNEKLIRKKLNKKKINFIYNKFYSSREMMHSVYLALKNCKTDLLVTYSDIFYSSKVIEKIILKKKNDAIYVPVLNNWKKIWKIRNKFKVNDAEDIKINYNEYITSIGQKISGGKIPKYQFMGIVLIPYKLKNKVINYYLKIKNKKKLHTTNFLDHLIKKKIKVKSIKLRDNWYEFDDFEDYENFKKTKW